MPKDLAEDFAALARALAVQPNLDATLATIVSHAVLTVDGAESAGITIKRGAGKYETVASTDEFPLLVDEIQYRVGEGPCVDSIDGTHVHRTDQVGTDPRWPIFGRLAAEQTAVASMLSHRLFLEEDNVLGALNLYSRKPGAFSALSESTLDVLAAHVAVALENARHRDENENLRRALESNRTIGVALGVLMTRHSITRDDAFGLLRIASQHTHQRLATIAQTVADTGELDVGRP
jgi:GAF domain-containing protein